MSKRIDEQFWSRAHLSREVFDIITALDAAGRQQLTANHRRALQDAIELLDAIQEGRRTIGQPEVSPRWAFNAIRYRSAANALARLKDQPAQLDASFLDYLNNVRTAVTTVANASEVSEQALKLAGDFFSAMREILMSAFGSPHERSPVRYL